MRNLASRRCKQAESNQLSTRKKTVCTSYDVLLQQHVSIRFFCDYLGFW